MQKLVGRIIQPERFLMNLSLTAMGNRISQEKMPVVTTAVTSPLIVRAFTTLATSMGLAVT
ncbi:hypothetical protein CHR90_02930 [Elstera cyanobacteriorum]|uniref:Uncharacterized protein n=1 Tax=Elstera cyanobacteriorum TaxID=2022747 RepID=A0A255XVA9_9PROT|nr:hypothetical protein CHR90_02930 [Elstera cyanobacteriorum]